MRKPAIRRSSLAGFLLSGFLFALLGSLLPVWGYDVSNDYASAGRHFLAFALGAFSAGAWIQRKRPRLPTRTLLLAGCALATLAFCALALTPATLVYRLPGVFLIGIGAGLLHAGLFEAILPEYDRNTAETLSAGGIFFGCGSILCALVVSGTFWAYSVQRILLLLAILPASFFVVFARRVYPPLPILSHPEVLKQFRSGAAILFSLLLFFQFGNEWSVAGWLPLFLIHGLGTSPVAALELLACYFASLTVGRIAVSALLPRVHHWRLLAGSAILSLFSCMVLATTTSRFGASLAIAFLGLAFAPIYPLVAAWIGRRFPYYHPGFFNGIFSVALAGGMIAPWVLGEIAARSGISAIMTLPAIGTCMVLLVLGLIWVEGKVTG